MVFALLLGLFVTVVLWASSPLPLWHQVLLLFGGGVVIGSLFFIQGRFLPDSPYANRANETLSAYHEKHRALIHYVQQNPKDETAWSLLAKSYYIVGERNAGQMAAHYAKTLKQDN